MVKFFLSFILFLDMFAYTDLGTYGKQYDISEKDALYQLKQSFKDFNKTKALLNFKKSLNKYLDVNYKIPQCIENTNSIFDPTIILKHDINMPKYNLFFKKGEKFNPLKYATIQKYIMFIDGTNINQIALAQKYAQNSMIILTKGNLKKVSIATNTNVYKINKYLIKAFHLKCTPTIYIANKDVFQKLTYDLREKGSK